MKLTETTVLTSADFPIAEFRDYLRLGSGFTDDGAQDGLLETCLRAAMGAIEARTSKVLIARAFSWRIYRWPVQDGAALLPVTPITAVTQVSTYTVDGTATAYLATDFDLREDTQKQKLVPISGGLPKLPHNGSAVVDFTAGFGAWASLPPALQQAMLMLAARYYENRDSMLNGAGQMPLGVATLVAPFQRIRLGGAP